MFKYKNDNKIKYFVGIFIKMPANNISEEKAQISLHKYRLEENKKILNYLKKLIKNELAKPGKLH